METTDMQGSRFKFGSMEGYDVTLNGKRVIIFDARSQFGSRKFDRTVSAAVRGYTLSTAVVLDSKEANFKQRMFEDILETHQDKVLRNDIVLLENEAIVFYRKVEKR